MKENIFENFDFGSCPPEQEEDLNERFSWFINIINDEIKENIGNLPELSIEPHVRSNENDWCHYEINIYINRSGIFTIYLDENNYLILESPFLNHHQSYGEEAVYLKFNPELIFKDYCHQMINDKLIPRIKELYEIKFIKELPEKLLDKKEKKLDFSKLTEEWLENKFNEISEDIMNGETIENIKINETNGKLKIIFDVDCDRSGTWKNNSIEINNRGSITVRLDDTPLEGCGIEDELKSEIKKLITE